MKKWGLLIILIFLKGVVPAQILKSSHVKLSFFSKAPIEDIYAVSEKGVSALNADNGLVYFKVPVRSFEFEKQLMKKHFNENYLESDKFPFGEFKGEIQEGIDPKKNGVFSVTVKGKLTVHNVAKEYTVKGKLEVEEGQVTASAAFPVSLADHDVQIPRILIKNIAETVEVTVEARYAVVTASNEQEQVAVPQAILTNNGIKP